MRFFGEIRHDKALPVAVELIRGAAAFKAQPRAALCRFYEKVHLGIVAQRLEMPDAVHGSRHRLLIGDTAGGDLHIEVEPLAYELGEHLGLHPAHYVHAYLAQALVPPDMKLGILILELPQLLIGRQRVRALGEGYAVAHDGFRLRLRGIAFKAEPLTCVAAVKSLYGDDASCRSLLHRLVICAGIDAQLGDGLSVYTVAVMQGAACYLHAAEPAAARIAHDLVHPRAEGLGIVRSGRVFFDEFHELPHAL